MTPRRASSSAATPRSAHGSPRVTIVTLDNHLVGALRRAKAKLDRRGWRFDLAVHVAADWDDPAELDRLATDVAASDLVFVSQLFLQETSRRATSSSSPSSSCRSRSSTSAPSWRRRRRIRRAAW